MKTAIRVENLVKRYQKTTSVNGIGFSCALLSVLVGSWLFERSEYV